MPSTRAPGSPAVAVVPRAENRTGWQLLNPSPFFSWGEANWPIRHHSHRFGHLIWHDNHKRTGWELAVFGGVWEDEGQEFDIDIPVMLRYLPAPPARRNADRLWADPTDALLTLAGWHYCPRTALTTLFRLVDKGASADEASGVVHIHPDVGERLVRRAQQIRSSSGLPLLAQVDGFLPIRESDWKAGLDI